MNGETLKERFKEIRGGFDENHRTRLHRAISWLRCAEKYADADEDVSFITLWIAFNSLYSIDDNRTDHRFREDFDAYTEKLLMLDHNKRIHQCLWTNFSGFARLLIENQFVYGPYWQSQRDGNDDWKEFFAASKKKAMNALGQSDTARLLRVVMERLYVLRNQLVHGGATWQGSVNREQVHNGKLMMLELVPVFIELMFDDSIAWGPVYYPVTG